MKKPFVSIIIPTYNEEKYLGAALASIRQQKFSKPYEIIIGDGFSKDRTTKIAKAYKARVFQKNCKTAAAARHTGALAARGEILAFTGADVEVDPEWLENLTRPIVEGKADWVLGKIYPLGGGLLDRFAMELLEPLAKLMNFIGFPYVYAENLACKKSVYMKVGGFNPKIVTGEDTDLAIRLRKVGKFAFASDAKVRVSLRRLRKWGYLKYLVFHVSNFLRSHFFSSPAPYYEPVR
ncbi:MAG: glycosyltransferase [Candidatus Micrarchaeota archaeon]|nr:glycosyltransferase [Candidatus Micrarchaeota archaeon]